MYWGQIHAFCLLSGPTMSCPLCVTMHADDQPFIAAVSVSNGHELVPLGREVGCTHTHTHSLSHAHAHTLSLSPPLSYTQVHHRRPAIDATLASSMQHLLRNHLGEVKAISEARGIGIDLDRWARPAAQLRKRRRVGTGQKD
jgi:hypothetical protein